MTSIKGDHNRSASTAAKVQLRVAAVDWVGRSDARVLDVFCGPEGLMAEQAYSGVAEYAGIDLVWKWKDDERRRYVGDATTVLRSIDLSQFNVFDVDSFGEPWEQVLSITGRVSLGGRFALILTSGMTNARFGGVSKAMVQLLGSDSSWCASKSDSMEWMHRACIRATCARVGRSAKQHLQARSERGSVGGMPMAYDCLLFEAVTPGTQAVEEQAPRADANVRRDRIHRVERLERELGGRRGLRRR